MNSPSAITPVLALERRLRGCPLVRTLGVYPNFSDYTPSEQELIADAPKIYYPSAFYAELFNAMGKATFPSLQTYGFAQDKIKQTALFGIAGINHPRTRVFYGKRQKRKILEHFSFPFIAKVPRGSALGRGVFLINSPETLDRYCQRSDPAYIQAYLPIDRDIRVVVIGRKVVHAYWRTVPEGDYRSNLGVGGKIDLAPVPKAAREMALYTAKVCGWDDVGIDICMHNGRYYVLEGNMKYGLRGFELADIDYHQLMSDMIAQGEI